MGTEHIYLICFSHPRFRTALPLMGLFAILATLCDCNGFSAIGRLEAYSSAHIYLVISG